MNFKQLINLNDIYNFVLNRIIYGSTNKIIMKKSHLIRLKHNSLNKFRTI